MGRMMAAESQVDAVLRAATHVSRRLVLVEPPPEFVSGVVLDHLSPLRALELPDREPQKVRRRMAMKVVRV